MIRSLAIPRAKASGFPIADRRIFLKDEGTVEAPSVHYQCQRCGNCCRWPGQVRLAEGEGERIALHLGLPAADFVDRFTQLRPDRSGLSLASKPNHECIFLEGANECKIQAVKPRQCAGFPNAWNFPGWRALCEAIPVTENMTCSY